MINGEKAALASASSAFAARKTRTLQALLDNLWSSFDGVGGNCEAMTGHGMQTKSIKQGSPLTDAKFSHQEAFRIAGQVPVQHACTGALSTHRG